jgi:hypothetical protein
MRFFQLWEKLPRLLEQIIYPGNLLERIILRVFFHFPRLSPIIRFISGRPRQINNFGGCPFFLQKLV